VTVFTEDGKKMTKDEYDRKKYLDSLKSKLTIQDESDVSSGDDHQMRGEYIEKVKKNLQKNELVDTELAKAKLKEKRIKTKKRLRELDGDRPTKSD